MTGISGLPSHVPELYHLPLLFEARGKSSEPDMSRNFSFFKTDPAVDLGEHLESGMG